MFTTSKPRSQTTLYDGLAPYPRCKDGELSEGHRIAIAVEFAVLFRRGRCRHFFCSASVLVLVWSPSSVLVSVWSPKCLGFVWVNVILVLVQWEATWIRGDWDRARLLFGLPRKCIGFSVGPLSVLFSVWSPKCIDFRSF